MNYAIITNGIVSNVYISEYALNELDVQSDTAQIGWSYSDGVFTAPIPPSPTAQQIQAALVAAAQLALDKSDITVMRCYSAAVAVPTAWQTYREALRAIVNGSDTTSTSLPSTPTYPAGT